ncbi:MAG TPA: crosslink repair DNA glycosylase YcaQ family protein [Anaerolineales bacterium]|nr:crosslink repair DNA glycosylase YcaQ family protein [Anaerolineales bacterium]
MEPGTVYTLSAARTLALYAQGLVAPNISDTKPTREAIQKIVERLGCIQIDTLNLVQRSHYLVLWSRLGTYNPIDFDTLAYSPEHRSLFEGWQRIASYIPLKDYRYQLPRMLRMREDHSEGFLRWFDKEGHALMDMVLERIRTEGALRAADFEYHGPRRGSWWDWKPAKTALEYLFALGDLMITNRIHFQRVYDLTERVLPAWADTSAPSLEQRDRFWLVQAALALGIAQPNQLIGYNYYRRGEVRDALQALIKDGVLVSVDVRLANGEVLPYLVHRDSLEVLQQAADGILRAERTTFLSPFDNLWWAPGRDVQLWGFRQRLEAYTPSAKRVWGYFCLPILHKDRLVGRFDPKLERKEGLLRLKALYLEEGVAPDEELVSDVAYAMRDFMKFHQAKELVIEKSQPEEFWEKLLKMV